MGSSHWIPFSSIYLVIGTVLLSCLAAMGILLHLEEVGSDMNRSEREETVANSNNIEISPSELLMEKVEISNHKPVAAMVTLSWPLCLYFHLYGFSLS